MIQIDTTKKGAVAQFIKEKLEEGATVYLPSSIFTIYALDELKDVLKKSNKVKFLFNKPAFIKNVRSGIKNVKEFKAEVAKTEKNVSECSLEIGLKNKLDMSSVASQCYLLLEDRFEVRSVTESNYFQANQILIDNITGDSYLINGINLEFSKPGLGYTDKPKPDFVFAMNEKDILDSYKDTFNAVWERKDLVEDVKEELLKHISTLYKENSPEMAYYITLYNLFNEKLINDDEVTAMKEATGITHTKVWSMLFNFQQDAVVGAIHKIQKYDGCIIADSVGLGKTFEALAIIKYYELKNERVLVLCPKKLRGNWTGFKQNTKTNPLLDDKFNYDILNHTDLNRVKGKSGDIDLAKINWGNYDLVVIDESHAFRNSPARNDRITRYSRLMESIIKQGIKTKVLMLSATPVNNKLTDLKNQISLITREQDDALYQKGKKNVKSISQTLRIAQLAFNSFAKKPQDQWDTKRLISNLDYAFFDVLDTYTIARSRKHIQKYYDTNAIGKFPTRLKPQSEYCKIDLNDKFPSISIMSDEIETLKLCVYMPLSYLLDTKRDEYAEKYKTLVKNGEIEFSQIDRERNLVNLMRINILKRLESGVDSFKLTIERILNRINKYLDMLDGGGGTFRGNYFNYRG